MSTLGLFVLTFLTILAIVLLDRLRRRLPRRGLVPRILGLAHLALRFAAVVMLIMVVARLLPIWLRPYLFLALAAAAIAFGFGAVWAVLPDVMGGLVLLAERRVRPGQWLVTETLAGEVQHVGLRVTVLSATDGARVTIPNRALLRHAVHTSERRWHDVDVTLTAPTGVAARVVRAAIADAVLCSPHVPANPTMTIARDPDEPRRWRVRTKVLEPALAVEFEGQLLERVEEALADGVGQVAPEDDDRVAP